MRLKIRPYTLVLALFAISLVSYAMTMPSSQDDKTRNSRARRDTLTVKAQPKLVDEDCIPDSLLNPRWKIQRTVPITIDDLDTTGIDLDRPDNLRLTPVYNDTLNRYVIGSKIGDWYVSAPLMMTPGEYYQWSERRLFETYFRNKNAEIYKNKGKEKFDFTDMHFDLGPAEKIFGPGGVRIRTQGTAELKFGGTIKKIDNPSLPIRNRHTTAMDFDEKINVNVNGRVGDKVNMNLNYNTDATFDFDTQNLKLKYDGKEDEIVKLVEGGNVSFPSNSSLIRGASSLFGLRTDLQFGKLKLQMVASQKKSSNSSVSSKGGVQLTPVDMDVSDYEENTHFFLSKYFRETYDASMKTLPNLTSGIKINRVEVWVTNKTGVTTNTRSIIALTDLGENRQLYNPMWTTTGLPVSANQANSEYATLVNSYAQARDIDQTSTALDAAGLVGGSDYEKLEKARLLNPSEYTINTSLGYISLQTSLQSDQVLAVAYEYTYGGQTFQVGEFATDLKDVNQALFVKSLKNISNNPKQGNWALMMKNVYRLASNIEREKFRLDVKYQSDTAGVYLTYIPEKEVKDRPIIRLLGADRLDNNNKAHSNGYFDFVEGFTVNNGRVFFPVVEPFGSYMYEYLIKNGVAAEKAGKYAFTELYDSTKTIAKQIAEKNKYVLTGQFKGSSANVISLNSFNIPQGSVVVTAGGVTLSEGTDYSVDYNAGEVTILNQSIIDAGTPVNVSAESNNDYAQQRKTMFGLNWEYDFTKDFQLSGTIQHLSEQPLTNKVNMGYEPLDNTLWGVNVNWKKESQWLTNMLDKLPLLHLTQPSRLSFNAEFAQLFAGQNHGTQDNASYLDDFENTTNKIDVSQPTSWIMSSVPSLFPESSDKTTLKSGFNRSLLAWYSIDPLFTRINSSLTPAHIKSDLDQLSDYYVREVYVRELYPNRQQNSYAGATSTLPILNLAYYPNERGPYNFNPDLNRDGTLNNPERHWGGMMRKLDYSDFQASNVEYIEFWLLDPFIYTRNDGTAGDYGGDFYINLGDVSEDILKDGRKFYESGLPVDGSQSFTTTQWGKIPEQATVTYAFSNDKGAREKQDLGFNGLSDSEERTFGSYQDFLTEIQGKVSPSVLDSIMKDPANDNYHYFRGTDYDDMKASIHRRYKYINNPQGNSPSGDNRNERYDTSYKTTPDAEDINQDYTLNEYENYFQYHVSIRPEDLVVGQNFIVDKRENKPTLRNKKEGLGQTWYLFRIPIRAYQDKKGSISDFTSIRFMRMFLTGFKHPVILRFASLDLVRGEWRQYEQNLSQSAQSGRLNVSSVNIEENNDKMPVNYILPPGIRRNQDPTQPEMLESNEQAMDIKVDNLSPNEAKAVYKNTNIDMREYKRLQMFVHANANDPNATDLQDGQMAVFIRLGSDYKSNYYEYEIPLTLTPFSNKYGRYSRADAEKVWPKENMLDIPMTVFTDLKKQRNKEKASGQAAYNRLFASYDPEKPNNKVSIMGNPSLGEVKTMVIGVRNLSGEIKSGEVWVNELRLKEYNNEGGWAAQGNLNMQLSDLGNVNLQGSYLTSGFGGLEEGVMQRSMDDYQTYNITANLELGKFFPDKAKVQAPLYYSVQKEKTSPKYNPLDTDMKLSDTFESITDKQVKDSISNILVTSTTNTNFSLSNVRVGIQTKRHPMPYDPANFSFSYSHSHHFSSGENIVHEKEDNWHGSMDYNWSPVYRPFEPFKKIRSRSKWYDILKRFGLNWLPQTVAFNTDITRNYYELQERDMEDMDNSQLPLIFNAQFLWNRSFNFRWDLTKNLHANFQSATHAEIEEPYTPVNKNLYPDRYSAWKDSVKMSFKQFGLPLDYTQQASLSYQLPLSLLPVFDWLTGDASCSANYNWVRGTKLENGQQLGNSISNHRQVNLNGTFNLVKLYNHVPFLKKTNERFDKAPQSKSNRSNRLRQRTRNVKKKDDKAEAQKQALPKNKRAFEQEITLLPDTNIVVKHGKNTRRILVSARSSDGKKVKLKFRKTDNNTITIRNKVDSALKLKITVLPKEPLDGKSWYKTTQSLARVLMMVRNVSFSYRNDYSMSLPGFMPMIGDAFGQSRTQNVLSPGLDFAFGIVDDSYIDKARRNNWLLMADSIVTPALTHKTEDFQIRATLEPFRNFKIDLNGSRMETVSKNIQYMFEGNPTTQNGTFTMTTLSIGSAFEGIGNANSGYKSATFEKFCNSLQSFRDRVEQKYEHVIYPQGTPFAGERFDPAKGQVQEYGSDVMIPAFLAAYTSASDNSLELFPSLLRMLPNWSIRYSGLGNLPWLRDVFKSVNLSHAYRSIFAIGSYSTFSTFSDAGSGLGFVNDATSGNLSPSSMYNISTVSLSESFSPLLGLELTFQNNLTARLNYSMMRNLNLSMTSVQINEAKSRDWTIGMGWRINNVNLFGRKAKRNRRAAKNRNQQNNQQHNQTAGNANRNLSLNLDLTYRRQATISRDIATRTSNVSSGNTAFKMTFSAEYTLSRLVSMMLYYDLQSNSPLLSSNSYPTVTQDFGASLKISLTR